MTDAAGPESMVKTGRFFISLISITPPSPRIIIKETLTPASRTESSVVNPYNFVMSEAIVVGIDFTDAAS